MLHYFTKRKANGANLSRLVKEDMLNEQGKFDMKIFFCYIYIYHHFRVGVFYFESPSRIPHICINVSNEWKPM